MSSKIFVNRNSKVNYNIFYNYNISSVPSTSSILSSKLEKVNSDIELLLKVYNEKKKQRISHENSEKKIKNRIRHLNTEERKIRRKNEFMLRKREEYSRIKGTAAGNGSKLSLSQSKNWSFGDFNKGNNKGNEGSAGKTSLRR